MRAFLVTQSLAWKQAWANQASFWSSIAIMMVNDAVWILFWVLSMRSIDDISGWDLDQIIILQAVFMTGAGLALGVLGNVKNIPELIMTGRLDSLLTQPISVLPQLLALKVYPIHVGDTAFGITLFLALGNPTPTRVLVFAICCLCSCLVVTSFLVLAGCLTFFAGRPEPTDSSTLALLMFSNYPIDIFSGLLKLTLYVVVPAAFVASFPARIVIEFDGQALAILVGVAFVMTVAASLTFRLGLKHYTSGAGWAEV